MKKGENREGKGRSRIFGRGERVEIIWPLYEDDYVLCGKSEDLRANGGTFC